MPGRSFAALGAGYNIRQLTRPAVKRFTSHSKRGGLVGKVVVATSFTITHLVPLCNKLQWAQGNIIAGHGGSSL
jgi:hypothetical protein